LEGVGGGSDPQMGHASAHLREGISKNKKSSFMVHEETSHARRARTIGDNVATQSNAPKKGSFLMGFSNIGFVPVVLVLVVP
jgi:hypothetical protein